MKFEVLIQPPAELDIDAAYLYIRQRAPIAARRWFDGIRGAILSLEDFAGRCPLAPESDGFDEPIHQLLFGKRNNKYRILFVIRGRRVHVLHVRHGARLPMRPDEIES